MSIQNQRSHEMDILDQVARLFRAFPAGKNVDEHTLRDYCQAFAEFKLDVVADVVSRFRLGEIKRESHAFPPALAEIMVEMRKTQKFFELRVKRAAIEQNNEQHNEHGSCASPAVNYVLPKGHFLNRSKGAGG